jgi:hypothetical protein
MPRSSVPTVRELAAKRRAGDRRHANVERVIQQLQSGACLRLHYEHRRPVWTLTPGGEIHDHIARLVIACPSIMAVGDVLFEGLRSQTYRFSEDT